jgi:predicted dehydrogenase
MSNENVVSRRGFLGRSALTATGLAAGTSWLQSTALGASRANGANDRLRFGVIGVGGQGTHDAKRACESAGVECVAVADVADFRLKSGPAAINAHVKALGKKAGTIDTYKDYRRILDRKDIDAVIITTPDHWHFRPFLAALQAGKHIYQEKPLSHTIEEGLQMVEATKKHPKLTIQIGTHRRSGAHYPEARKLIEDGVIGDITYVRAYDCRNFVTKPDPFAPRPVAGEIDWETFQEPCENKVPYDPHRYFAWRWFWEYAGGLVTDVGVHVMDICHWLTGESMPKNAVCSGGVYGFDYWHTPDVVNAAWEYDSHTVNFTSTFTNGWQGDGIELFGTKGTMEIRGADIYVWEDHITGHRGHAGEPIHYLPDPGCPHQKNWIDAIRTGVPVNAPVELGFSSLLPSLLANIAYREKRRVEWDDQAKKAV